MLVYQQAKKWRLRCRNTALLYRGPKCKFVGWILVQWTLTPRFFCMQCMSCIYMYCTIREILIVQVLYSIRIYIYCYPTVYEHSNIEYYIIDMWLYPISPVYHNYFRFSTTNPAIFSNTPLSNVSLLTLNYNTFLYVFLNSLLEKHI